MRCIRRGKPFVCPTPVVIATFVQLSLQSLNVLIRVCSLDVSYAHLAALHLSFLCSALVLGAGYISQHYVAQLCGIRRVVQTCSRRSTGLLPAHC